MYPVLILRSELVCLVILIFLKFTSRFYNVSSESKCFSRLLGFAILHVIFDYITVLTVNNIQTVPSAVNWICHVIFYLSAILFSNELANYVMTICYPWKAKAMYRIGYVLTAIYVGCLSFLKIEYIQVEGTYSSSGPAAIVGYGLAFLFFVAALVIIFTHLDMMSTSIKCALIPMMLVLMITEITQIIRRDILFTGAAVTIVTVGFFFSLENPVEVFKKKAMIDALTGVRSRNSYEEDIEEFDKRFCENPNEDYIVVFCDINDLRKVNNRFGHAEGDNYISIVAAAVKSCMLHSYSVYRIGGDEFLIMYYKTDVRAVQKEISALRDTCAKESEKLNYVASVSTGFAVSNRKYKSLQDVVKTADFEMYQNKKLKGTGLENKITGARLNYTGLTDKMFDVMCASNDRIFPFITNMDTNVTRIAPGWREYFGLESEFYENFISLWNRHIHPDYLDGYTEDVVSVITGRRKYHNYRYLAKKTDGEYVNVSCHASLYTDSSSNIPYFTGFLRVYDEEGSGQKKE